jgi:uncharacterized protein
VRELRFLVCYTRRIMKRRRGWWAAVLAMMTIVPTLASHTLASKVLLYPPAPLDEIAPAKRVFLADEAGAIETVRATVDEVPRAIILKFYGNAAQASADVVDDAARFGPNVEVWGVNYPGYGKSEGAARLEGVARAADVAYREARKRAPKAGIYVMGTSMGTTAALHLAATQVLSGLLLLNPPPLQELVRGEYGWWNLWLLAGPISFGVPAALDSVQNAQKTTCPVVVLSAERDTLVPLAYQQRVVDVLRSRKTHIVAPGIDHNDAIPEASWKAAMTALRGFGW